jgi:hypothetical protein
VGLGVIDRISTEGLPLLSDEEIIVENEIGLIEFRDKETGEVIATEKPSPKKKAKIDSGKPLYKKRKHELQCS